MAGSSRPPRPGSARAGRATAPDPLSVEVGARIRELRVARALSQEELAARAGIPPEQVARYESARQSATLRTLAKIALGLNVAPAELLRTGSRPVGAAPETIPEELRDLAVAVSRRGPVAVARARLAVIAALAEPAVIMTLGGVELD